MTLEAVLASNKAFGRYLLAVIQLVCLYWRALDCNNLQTYSVEIDGRPTLLMEPHTYSPRYILVAISLIGNPTADGYNQIFHPRYHAMLQQLLADHPRAWMNDFGQLCFRLR